MAVFELTALITSSSKIFSGSLNLINHSRIAKKHNITYCNILLRIETLTECRRFGSDLEGDLFEGEDNRISAKDNPMKMDGKVDRPAILEEDTYVP